MHTKNSWIVQRFENCLRCVHATFAAGFFAALALLLLASAHDRNAADAFSSFWRRALEAQKMAEVEIDLRVGLRHLRAELDVCARTAPQR